MKYSDRVVDLIDMIDSEDVDERVAAIEALGEIGDEECLNALRERSRVLSRELGVLAVAVGRLKKRLSGESS